MLTQHTIEEADEDRMSTEEHQQPPGNEDDERPIRKSVFRVKSLLDYWQIFVKLIELAICILCTGLIIDPLKIANVGSRYLHHISLIFTTYIGYMLILTILLLGRLFQDRLPYKTSAIFSLVGSCLFLATGCMLFAERDYLSRNHFFHPNVYMFNMLITSAIFAIINSIIFAFDAVFIIKLQNDL